MSEPTDTTIAFNVRLKPSESSAHPRAANYTNIGIAQGMAYLDFGFLEPAVLAALAKTTKDGQVAPKGLDGHLVTRVAMDLSALTRLYQQIQQVCAVCAATESKTMKERGLRNWQMLWQQSLMICLILTMGGSTSSCAGFLNSGGHSWREEVLLHDGRKIVVERTIKRGGRHEVGQKPPYKEQSLSFTVPDTKQTITWKDHFSRELGQANFLPMALDISGGTPYLVVYPMGCPSYDKWGRPNPPYVVFRYQEKEWTRIPLQELPTEITTPNRLFSQPDIQVERFGKRVITADMIRGVIASYPQPEFRTLQREPVKAGSLGSTNCEERVLYKGHWILPNDPIAREFIDRQKK